VVYCRFITLSLNLQSAQSFRLGSIGVSINLSSVFNSVVYCRFITLSLNLQSAQSLPFTCDFRISCGQCLDGRRGGAIKGLHGSAKYGVSPVPAHFFLERTILIATARATVKAGPAPQSL
jgi:hypothetical protein